MPEPIGVFISHRHEDRSLAQLVEMHLRTLGQDQLEIYVSHNMPGGTDYRLWIKGSVRKSDVFILLLTEPDANWEWCIFEAGRFLAKSDADHTGPSPWIDNLIVIKNASVDRIQGPLEGYQSVSGDKKSIRSFLIDFLEKGVYTGGNVIIPKLSMTLPKELDEASTAISERVSSVTNSIYYHEKLTISFEAGEHDIDGLLATASICAPRSLFEKLRCAPDTTTWNSLTAQLKNSPSGVWIEDLQRSLRCIFRADGEPRTVDGTMLEVMAPFRDAGYTKYVPVLLKLEKNGKQPKRIKVIFVQCNDYLRGSYALERETCRDQVQLVTLLRAARRFRWEILEPFAQSVAAIKNRISNADNVSLQASHDVFASRLARMQCESGSNFIDPMNVQTLLGIKRDQYIEVLYDEFFGLFDLMKTAVAENNLKAVNESIHSMRMINKRFLVLVSQALIGIVGRIEPVRLDVAEILRDAFSEPAADSSAEIIALTPVGGGMTIAASPSSVT
jgi:hypothetical protein